MLSIPITHAKYVAYPMGDKERVYKKIIKFFNTATNCLLSGLWWWMKALILCITRTVGRKLVTTLNPSFNQEKNLNGFNLLIAKLKVRIFQIGPCSKSMGNKLALSKHTLKTLLLKAHRNHIAWAKYGPT